LVEAEAIEIFIQTFKEFIRERVLEFIKGKIVILKELDEISYDKVTFYLKSFKATDYEHRPVEILMSLVVDKYIYQNLRRYLQKITVLIDKNRNREELLQRLIM